MLVLLVEKLGQDLGDLWILILQTDVIENVVRFSPSSLGITVAALNFVDIANHEEDVDVVGALVGVVLFADANKILEMFSPSLHVPNSEIDNAHGLVTRCDPIIQPAKHSSANLEGLGEAVQRLLILVHLAVYVSKSKLSVGHPFVVQSKLTFPGSETIMVAIDGGSVLLSVFVNVSYVFESISGLEGISILLSDLKGLVQQIQSKIALALLAFDKTHDIEAIANELMAVAKLLPANLQSIVETIKSFLVFSLICLLYTSPSPRDISGSRMPSSA